MKGIVGTSVVILVIAVSRLAESNIVIESPKETDWGVWGSKKLFVRINCTSLESIYIIHFVNIGWHRCSFGRYAQAVQLKTEPYQGLFEDDTAANAIRLYCGDPSNITTSYITSTEADWGAWGKVFSCRSDGRPLPPDGYVTGFQLRVEGPTAGDDSATNNIRVFCSYPNGVAEQTLEADGLTYGSWTDARRCNSNQAVCAIRTQVEPYQGDGDDTALNNVQLECCDR